MEAKHQLAFSGSGRRVGPRAGWWIICCRWRASSSISTARIWPAAIPSANRTTPRPSTARACTSRSSPAPSRSINSCSPTPAAARRKSTSTSSSPARPRWWSTTATSWARSPSRVGRPCRKTCARPTSSSAASAGCWAITPPPNRTPRNSSRISKTATPRITSRAGASSCAIPWWSAIAT